MIKKTIMPILFAAAVLFTACGDDKKSDKENEKKDNNTEQNTDETNETGDVTANPVIPEGFSAKELGEFGLEATIMGPEEAYIYNSTLVTNDGEQEQIIVQMDDASEVKLAISQTTEDMATIKKTIEEDMFREFTKYVLDDGKGVIYEAVKKSEEITVYHFVYLMEAGDVVYKIDSDTFQDYDLEQISTLYAMAQSITLK